MLMILKVLLKGCLTIYKYYFSCQTEDINLCNDLLKMCVYTMHVVLVIVMQYCAYGTVY